jgi:hypothetical protein
MFSLSDRLTLSHIWQRQMNKIPRRSDKKPKRRERGIDLSELKPEDFEPILPETMGRELRGVVKPREAGK